MIKKLLLMLSVMLLIFSCNSPSNPNNNNGGSSSDNGGNTGQTGQNKNFPEFGYISGINEVIKLTLGSYNFESGSVGTDFQSTCKDSNLTFQIENASVTVTALTFDSSDTASKDIGLVKEDFTITFNDMVVLSKDGVDKMKTKLKDGEYSKVKLQVKFSLEGYNEETFDNLSVQCIRENTGK